MKKIRLSLKERSYDILIGSGLLRSAGRIVKRLDIGKDAVIITNRKLSSLYGKTLERSLNRAGIKARSIFIPDSEKAKSLKTAALVLSDLSRHDKNSSLFIIALGGGVAGDLAGFAASIYKRGIPYIQIPTTLLAQVDSSIGGKTAVDLPIAKNLVGAFYQPRAVIADTSLVSTLPSRQLKSGLAEVIKYGVIKDPVLFAFIEKNIKKLVRGDRKALETVISRSAKIKADVVSIDELDNKGKRIMLNFGHTIGHAIEAAGGYAGKLNHGEAVAIGMIAAADIAMSLGVTGPDTVERLRTLIKNTGLPATVRGLSLDKIYDSLLRDKKFAMGKNRFVLPEKIGKIRVASGIPERVIREAVKRRVA